MCGGVRGSLRHLMAEPSNRLAVVFLFPINSIIIFAISGVLNILKCPVFEIFTNSALFHFFATSSASEIDDFSVVANCLLNDCRFVI
jgi:hypothetical protein